VEKDYKKIEKTEKGNMPCCSMIEHHCTSTRERKRGSWKLKAGEM
jgi:hypothetical protein